MAISDTEGEEAAAMMEEVDDDDVRQGDIVISFYGRVSPAPGGVSPGREVIMQRASQLVDQIVTEGSNVSAAVLNELASIVEEEEARYQSITSYPYTANLHDFHTIGRMLGLLRDNDEFNELYVGPLVLHGTLASRAAAIRLLLAVMVCCRSFPELDDAVVTMVKTTLLEEFETSSLEPITAKSLSKNNEKEKVRPRDFDLFQTYALGLYAHILASSINASTRHSELIDEALSRGLAGNLMRYLRHYILGEDASAKGGHKNTRSEDAGKAETSKKKAEVRDRGGRRSKSAKPAETPRAEKQKPRTQVPDSIEYELQENMRSYKARNVDISAPTRKAVLAARSEARGADASEEAIVAAGDAAADMVIAAALEAPQDDEAAVLAAAEKAAEAVVDAALSVARKEAEKEAEKQPTDSAPTAMEEQEVDDHFPDTETLAFLKARFAIQTLDRLGEYVEVLAPVLRQKGVDVTLAILRRFGQDGTSVKDMSITSDVLKMVSSLCAHRKYEAMLVDRGFIRQLLEVPVIPQTIAAISHCVFALGSVPNVMERVCGVSPNDVVDLVELAFKLLDAPQDVARRHAGLFFTSTFVFRPVVEAFDKRDGQRKLLAILSNTAALRSGNAVSDWNNNVQVLNSAERQVAHHCSVALRQYFRAKFLLLVESIRPCKHRVSRSSKSSCKPLDLNTEAIEPTIDQIQRDRKLATAFVRTKWPALDVFINSNGHLLLLDFCQASATDNKWFNDIAQHSLCTLRLVTLMPDARRLIVSSTLPNDKTGMSVILDAASGAAFAEPEVPPLALLVLVNLVCPPPAFSNRTSGSEMKDKADGAATPSSDSRISLGPGSGGPGLAACMEHDYRLARESVRTNNGIKVLLHLLAPRLPNATALMDRIRAIACRVLLGMARDETIAQILTKLQLGKILAELLRDGGQPKGGDQDRYQAELSQAALDLMGIVTNAGRANTVASEAAAPTLRRIERAAIAAATPISYASKELLQLIHEHLMSSGLTTTAATLLKEASLQPLPSSNSSGEMQAETHTEIHWPGSRFFVSSQKTPKLMVTPKKLITNKAMEIDPVETEAEPVVKTPAEVKTPSVRTLPAKRKAGEASLSPSNSNKRVHLAEGTSAPQVRFKAEVESDIPEPPTPVTPSTQQYTEMKSDRPSLQHTETKNERASLDSVVVQYLKHQHRQCPAPITTLPELSLLQPHSCPEPSKALHAPYNITRRFAARETYPPYGGMHGRRYNRQFIYSKFRLMKTIHQEDETTGVLTCGTFLGGPWCIATGTNTGMVRVYDPSTNGNPLRAYHQGYSLPVTSIQAAPYLLSGIEDDLGAASGARLLLSSSTSDVKLWNSATIAEGSVHTFENRKAARFNRAGTIFGALFPEGGGKEVYLYDVNTCNELQRLSDSSIIPSSSASRQSTIHFSPSDVLVLWNGVLWDHRLPRAIHRFDQFSDYGGGGFHPAGNEVIINSEVWDLRTFKLLRSVPSLDQTAISFNSSGDVIYANLRRNNEDVSTVLSRKTKHPLFAAFRTVDAVDYSEIGITQVDRCVLDLSVDPTDSIVGVVGVDSHNEDDSFVKFYEVGRRRPTEDDSDADAGEETEDEEDDEEDEGDVRIEDIGIDIGIEGARGISSESDTDTGVSSDEDDSDDGGEELNDEELNEMMGSGLSNSGSDDESFSRSDSDEDGGLTELLRGLG